ncbi:divergent protein kinase domain 2A-like [Amphiura filiformis]|uniref:divergent protein kinase domain 2A-like n=1 Tax=Amphiura filiformis TaxID=82378 RepID=UPI003B217CBC
MASLRRSLTRSAILCSFRPFRHLCIVILLFVGGLLYYHFFLLTTRNHLEDPSYLGVDKCPACYGTSLCEQFGEGHFEFESYSRLRFLDFINVKNVYFGRYLDKHHVILKKLAHNTELASFDKELCLEATQQDTCEVARDIYKTKFSEVLRTEVFNGNQVGGLSDLVRCPSQRLLQKIWNGFKERQSRGFMARDNKMMLMTTLAINPEPIILTIFPKSEGWPFPRYRGACGRFIVQEYIGKDLASYYKADWETRLDIAYQVMKIAEQFTYNEQEFGLYMTDVSFDNFAIDEEGKVFVVDAENIIVVDRRQIKEDAAPMWDQRHQAFHDECQKHPGCLTFSSEILCKRYHSDHNYYAVCHGILGADDDDTIRQPGGLLHDIPSTLNEKEQLETLLLECKKPSKAYGRYEIAAELLTLLAKLSGHETDEQR